MSDVIKLRTSADIDDEAAAWVWRSDGGLSPAQRREFDLWIRCDPRHRRAFEEMGGVWTALDGLAEAKRDEKLATFTRPHPRPAPQRRFSPWPAAAAALLVAALGTQVWMYLRSEAQTIATAVGQQREVTLADGSVISLNTNSIVETSFTRAVRDVRLIKGEAHFSVAKDADRPFLVHAGDAVVRAVGTRFMVHLKDADDVEVIVSEGRVEVTTDPAIETTAAAAVSRTTVVGAAAIARPVPGGRPTSGTSLSAAAQPDQLPVSTGTIARASQRVIVDGASVSVDTLDAATLSRQLAWREGAVVLDGEPLSQAVEMLNRYTELRLLVSDPAVARMRIGGRFKANDVEGFLHALQAALPVSVRRTDNGLVYIEPRR